MRGIGTYARGLVDGLCALGAGERIVLLRRGDDPLPAELAARGVRAGPQVPVVSRRLQPLLDPALVSRAVRSARPAVYHGVEWGQPAWPGGVPVTVTVHDLVPWLRGHHYRWQRRERLWALRLLRRADAVVTPSRSAAAEVVSIARVDPARVTVILSGVDGRFTRRSPDAVAATAARHGLLGAYVIAVGTQEPRKRLDVSVDAVLGARAAGADLTLAVAGDQAQYGPAVARELARLGDSGRLLGHVPLGDLVDLYGGARALLFTSDHEGFGLPVLEAMACGSPVVAVAATATPEAAGDAALLVPPGDLDGLVAALVTAVSDGPARDRLVNAGLARAASLTWERAAREYLALYDGLGRRRPSGGAPGT